MGVKQWFLRIILFNHRLYRLFDNFLKTNGFSQEELNKNRV